MKTINHECYVSLEVAKLLKEAGFDWKCIEFFDTFDCRYYTHNEPLDWNGETDIICSRPTLDVAQRWLREVKNEIVLVDAMTPKSYSVSILGRNSTTKKFDTYEEALEAGIKKVLKLILEKDEN